MPTDFIHKIKELIAQELPFALFALPNSDLVQLYFQKDIILHQADDLDFEGFILAPFQWNKRFDYIPNTFSLTVDKKELLVSHNQGNTISSNASEKAEIAHIDLVNRAIATINQGEISKIVCSRKENLDLEIDILHTFIMTLTNYPFAFNYVFQHPKLGKWLGASPELLLAYQNNTLNTVALAGTQAFKTKETAYVWRKKEQDEQQIVTDYIVSQLKQVSDVVTATKAKTSFAGKVLHLKSEISATITKTDLAKALDLLHPTPAVCGFPKEKALDFILKNENYNRSYYTGFLGVNSNDKLQLFVNLRCIELTKTVDLYIGGGINSASNAEEEWQETVLKATVMKGVLKF